MPSTDCWASRVGSHNRGKRHDGLGVAAPNHSSRPAVSAPSAPSVARQGRKDAKASAKKGLTKQTHRVPTSPKEWTPSQLRPGETTVQLGNRVTNEQMEHSTTRTLTESPQSRLAEQAKSKTPVTQVDLQRLEREV